MHRQVPSYLPANRRERIAIAVTKRARPASEQQCRPAGRPRTYDFPATLKFPASISAALDRLLWPALLALLAVAGYLLVTLPPMVVAQWRTLAVDHPVYSTV
jgi:hypothetical protein